MTDELMELRMRVDKQDEREKALTKELKTLKARVDSMAVSVKTVERSCQVTDDHKEEIRQNLGELYEHIEDLREYVNNHESILVEDLRPEKPAASTGQAEVPSRSKPAKQQLNLNVSFVTHTR